MEAKHVLVTTVYVPNAGLVDVGADELTSLNTYDPRRPRVAGSQCWL